MTTDELRQVLARHIHALCSCGFHGFSETLAHRPDCDYRTLASAIEALEADRQRLEVLEAQIRRVIEWYDRPSNLSVSMELETLFSSYVEDAHDRRERDAQIQSENEATFAAGEEEK